MRFIVWNKDPEASKYEGLPVTYLTEERMVPRTNKAAERASEQADYIGWVADDNRFRTEGWDTKVLDVLAETPIVFGNDVVSPGSKPSHVFMDSRIVRSLGWFLHPGLKSTFFDDVWANLGVGPIDVSGPLVQFFPNGWVKGYVNDGGLGIKYLNDVVVEHLYIERDNSKDFMADMAVYQQWLRHECENDIARASRALRRGRYRPSSSISTASSSPPSPGIARPSTAP